MKRVLLAIVLTVSSVIFSLFSGSYVENKLLTIEESFYSIYASVAENDFLSAEEKLNNVEQYWNKNKLSVGLFISGEDCEKLEGEIKNLRIFIKNRSVDSALESISECLNLLFSIKENEKLTVDSIL